MTTFDDWWAAYDPDDVNTAADRGLAKQAWGAASDAWLARVRELEQTVAELRAGPAGPPPPNQHEGTAR